MWTWLQNWLSGWMGSSESSGGLGSNQHVQRDCPICCPCPECAGVGYWSEYDIYIPPIIATRVCKYLPLTTPSLTDYDVCQEIFETVYRHSMLAHFMNVGRTFRVTRQAGGICSGACAWRATFNGTETVTICEGQDPKTIAYQFVFEVGINYVRLTWTASTDPLTPNSRVNGDYLFSGTPTNCRTAFNNDLLYFNGSTTVPTVAGGCPSGLTFYDIFDGNIVATPAGTWTSCGQDSSGTPIGDGLPTGPGPLSVAAAAAARIPLRTVRCLYLGRRVETSGCCDGGRRHVCDLGLPAVPGGYCQTCNDYVPDGDASW